jgi:RNA 2',3'-cyclic 3'-phosphodiesterase
MTSPRRTWPGADEPGRRLFVAVPLPAETIAAVTGLVESVRSLGVPGGGRDVRWVRLEGLHVTLRFLGPTPESRVAPSLAAVRSTAPAIEPFEIVLGGAGAFPSGGRRPRALWLGVQTGAEDLTAAAAEVDRALVTAGWPPETRPFRAHLTLARSDGVAAGSAVAERLIAAAADLRLRVPIDRIGLFESLTGGGPARYEPLEVVPLG